MLLFIWKTRVKNVGTTVPKIRQTWHITDEIPSVYIIIQQVRLASRWKLIEVYFYMMRPYNMVPGGARSCILLCNSKSMLDPTTDTSSMISSCKDINLDLSILSLLAVCLACLPETCCIPTAKLNAVSYHQCWMLAHQLEQPLVL